MLGDRAGNLVHLLSATARSSGATRRSSEESPCPAASPGLVQRRGEVAVRGALAAGHHPAGTFEFLLAEDGSGGLARRRTRHRGRAGGSAAGPVQRPRAGRPAALALGHPPQGPQVKHSPSGEPFGYPRGRSSRPRGAPCAAVRRARGRALTRRCEIRRERPRCDMPQHAATRGAFRGARRENRQRATYAARRPKSPLALVSLDAILPRTFRLGWRCDGTRGEGPEGPS
ncbi:hypothetical protein AB3662_12940 [Sorangium cellulosum]|uniref:hypothetical protein n=1 Tax=Sorangium cellulosum TaxID=56 RepID=UPI003D9A7DB1